jgi:hypothetical protein
MQLHHPVQQLHHPPLPQAYALVPLMPQPQHHSQTFSPPPSFNTGGSGGWDQQLSQLPPLYSGDNASHHTAPIGGWMPSATQFPSQSQQQHRPQQQQQHHSVPCLPPSMPLGREYAAAPAAPSFGGNQQMPLYHSQQQRHQQHHFAGPPPNVTFDAQPEFTSHNRIYAPLPLMFEPSQQQLAEQIQQPQRQQQQHYWRGASSASSAQYHATGTYAQSQCAGQQVPTMSLSMLQPPPAVAPRQYGQPQHPQLSQQQNSQPQQHQLHLQQQFQSAQQQLVPLSADSASVATVLAPLSRDLLSKAAATSAALAPALTAASTTSALRPTASPLSSRSSASSRSSSSASEGGSNSSTGVHKKRRRDVHLLHRDFALHERLVTRDNHQFGHHFIYSWAADETVTTVEESTRAAHRIRKVKRTFLEGPARVGGGSEVMGNRRLDQQVRRITRKRNGRLARVRRCLMQTCVRMYLGLVCYLSADPQCARRICRRHARVCHCLQRAAA